MQTAEPLVPLKFQWLLKSYKDTSHLVLITFQEKWLKQEVGQFFLRSINLLILYRNCWGSAKNQSLFLCIRKVTTQTEVIIEAYHFWSTTYKILSSILPLRSIPYAEDITGDHQCGIRHNRSTTDHIFCIQQLPDKKWEYNEAMHQLVIDFKKAYDSVRREVLYNILIECGIPLKLVRLIKMCLNETSRVWVGEHLSCMFPIKKSLKRDALSSLPPNFL